MSLVSTIEHDKRTITPTTRQPLRISKRIKHACSLLASGRARTVTDAAKQAKLSREHLSKQLSKPHVRAFVNDKIARNLQVGALQASEQLPALVYADSEQVRLQASKELLRSQGFIAPEGGTTINVAGDMQAGYVVNWQNDREPQKPAIDVTPTDKLPTSGDD